MAMLIYQRVWIDTTKPYETHLQLQSRRTPREVCQILWGFEAVRYGVVLQLL